MPSAFLSEQWIADAQAALSDHADAIPPQVRMVANLIVHDAPSEVDSGTIEVHLGNHETGPIFARGIHDNASVTIRADYATAYSIFLSGDPQAGLQALMAGKVKISGDLAALMAAAAEGGVSPGNPELAERLRTITA